MNHDGFDISHLDLSYEHKTQCPKCHSNGGDTSCDNLHIYGYDRDGNNKGFHCYTCGYHMNDETYFSENSGGKSGGFTLAITQKDLNKLNEKKLSQEKLDEEVAKSSDKLVGMYRALDPIICYQLGIRWKYNDQKKVSEMLFPATIYENGEIVTTGYKVRKDPKDFYSIGYVGKANLLAGQTKAIAETLIIVEGEIDLVSAKQMLLPVTKKYNKSINVVSSLVGANSVAEVLKVNLDYVTKHKKIILCLDADDAGKAAVEECLKFLPRDKTFLANLRHNDPNEYMRYGDEEFFAQDVYWNAAPIEDFGVIGSDRLFDRLIERLEQDKIDFPFFLSDLAKCFTDDALWLGEWVNWISSTSTGKSTVIDAWMVDWALHCQYRQAIFSYESDSKSFGVKAASLATSRSIMKIQGKQNRIDFANNHRDEIMKLLRTPEGDPRFDFVDQLPNSIQGFKQLVNYLVNVRNVKVLWIDPILDLLSIAKTKNEYDEMIQFLDRVRMEDDVTIISVLHTRKNLSSGVNGSDGGGISEEDAYGGREITAKATVNITAERNKNADNWIERNTMLISVRKNRTDQITGQHIAKLFYRAKANRLYPYSYAEERKFFIDDSDKTVEEIVIDEDNGFNLKHLGVDNIDVEDGKIAEEEKLNW